ncbi:MAG TPA: DUF433 domain-containing protein [Gemmataceae bacterium]|jgi:uncharacterized protein (DUF433 family)|nr:DUF433 domain-containing protein [Gemmataceae bacterium]
MSVTIAPESPPLAMDDHGRIRVGGMRVTLDLIVHDYKAGLQANQIVAKYDVLDLGEVYAAIAYYLRHTTEVEEYLARREADAQAIREQIETSQPPFPSRAELIARRTPPGLG